MYYTNYPLEFEDWIDDTYPGLRADLRQKALLYEKVDWKTQAEFWESQVLLGTA